MKKVKDKLDKREKHKLPEKWKKAVETANPETKQSSKITHPSLQLDSSREDVSMAAYVSLAMAGQEDAPWLKNHAKGKKYRKEVDDL